MELGKHEKVKCPWCGRHSVLGMWDIASFKFCTNAEMKKDFTHLTDSKAFDKNTDAYYVCPKCHKWSKGCQLRIIGSTNKELEQLGGEPIFKSVDN